MATVAPGFALSGFWLADFARPATLLMNNPLAKAEKAA
jgi:hypothetical protein